MAIAYTTKEFLRDWTRKNATRAQDLVAKAEKRGPDYATFLSHSTLDKDILPPMILLLENHGASVYVDKKDGDLPPYTSRDTAKILKDRILDCRKFVLLASDNSKDSRWVPWELGLADGYKRHSNVAIFPAVESETDITWTKREYLGIYDRIVWGDLAGESRKVWMVYNQEDHTAKELSMWLAA